MKSFINKMCFPLKPFPALILSIIITGLIYGAGLMYDSQRTAQMVAPAAAIKTDENIAASSGQTPDAAEDKDTSTEEAVTESISTKQNNDETEEQGKSTKTTASSHTSYSSNSSSSRSFSNEYGTSTTKCAHPGCNNPIASSGDTNCCIIHSRRCLECGKYIDEDATYCMSCLTKALQPSNNTSSGSSSSSYGSSGTSSGSYDFSGYSDSMSDAEFDAWLGDVLGF